MADISDDSQLLYFNGIDGTTGGYALPPMSRRQLARYVLREPPAANLESLQVLENLYLPSGWHITKPEPPDLSDLAVGGWGVLFAADADPAIEEALQPLLALRREQAGDLFHLFNGPNGLQRGESTDDWLERQGMSPGYLIQSLVPYYLLLVGSPEEISFRFQTELETVYAPGRLHFDTAAEYADYAASLLRAETVAPARPRRAVLFGAINGDDPTTNKTAATLIDGLAAALPAQAPGWQFDTVRGPAATKRALGELLGGPDAPAVLFTTSHGNELPLGHADQRKRQGALVTSDWPGVNEWAGRGPIPTDHLMCGEDLAATADLTGQIVFLYACYSGGTPLRNEYAHLTFSSRPPQIAAAPFVADLPRRMLGRPGGAAAVISHVERVWNCSYEWGSARHQTAVFETALAHLLAGRCVGHAFEAFSVRYSHLATIFNGQLQDRQYGEPIDEGDLIFNWTANNDARGYIIIGDPAARINQT